MGAQAPYLYDAPRRESAMDVPSTFDPKAITRASRQPPSPKKKRPDGPYLNFNQHPDSHVVLPYGKTNVKPMSPKIKTTVTAVRWVQFTLRLLNLIGAVGAVLCGIFIRGATDTEGYVMRIPPGVDIVVALYAIYHLLRNSKSRPAASSASYHFFALVTDAGFIPFYVFTALLSKRNLDEEAGTVGRWRTFFPTDEETAKILLSEWLIAVTIAALHLVSLFLDIWLVLVFRKIARLPPDMNPLEDNLTSRRKTKHKYKDSSTSAITALAQDDKRFSAQTTSTVAYNRDSQAAPLMSDGNIPSPDRKQMAFMHTRNDSGMAYSPHTPNSARQSRERFSMYGQPASNGMSRPDVNNRDDLHRRRQEPDEETLAERKSMLAQKAIKRSSKQNSFVTSSTKQDFYTPPATANGEEQDIGLQNNRESLQTDNWFVFDEPGEPDEPERQPTPPRHSVFPSRNQGYNTVATYDDASDYEATSPGLPQPLHMNPPTPPPSKVFREVQDTPPSPGLQRTKTVTSMSSQSTFNRSPTRGAMKTRYYGDLKAAQQAVRGPSPANSPAASPTKQYVSTLPSAAKQYTTNSPSPAIKIKNAPFSLDKKTYHSVRKTGTLDTGYTPVRAVSPRVVSRSGVDYEGAAYFDDDADLGTAPPVRRRDVSGVA
ncbi:hypothetical protein P280DRAFT_37974 [Massarina eburnea CBS 473.64]|uniref:Uncharacterized protein n=1 Tax=Massarina eburnea CBS 473.64 TaxID=1395130 RepID=A0A6A6RZ31_9PLEO|nr:hypothetical protein P280DRAFT_37974 [Massarina eburnea CBS 473.64]